MAAGGTFDKAVSCALYGAMTFRSAAYGAMVCSCGPAAMTPLMAAWLAPIVVSTAIPLAPPPAAATACACRAGLAGLAASLVNRAGWAAITASSGANFWALASCGPSLDAVASTVGGTFWAVATTAGWVWAKASWLPYWAA